MDFTITTAGVVNPSEQTYTLTLTYTDASSTLRTMEMDVVGTTGTFSGIVELPEDAVTLCSLSVEAYLPVFSSWNFDQISSYKTLSATTTAAISTKYHYVIGAFYGNSWAPDNAIKGKLLSTILPTYPDADRIYYWEDMTFIDPLSSEYSKFRFIDGLYSDWTEVNEYAVQYYPSSLAPASTSVVPVPNMFAVMLADGSYTSDPWMPYTTTTGAVDCAWAPDTKTVNPKSSSVTDPATNGKYNIYLNLADKTMAMGWLTPTGLADALIDKLTQGNPVDVYNLQGLTVRRAADPSSALDGLPAGIYIIGGRKWYVP